MKKESFKSKDQLEDLIAELDQEMGHDQAGKSGDWLPDITPTGNLVPDEYHRGTLFPQIQNYLPAEMVKDLTSDEKVLITKGIQRKLTGLSANMPITCYGDSCPFRAECPLHKIGKAPEGQSCPIESMVLDLYSKRYIDEFEVESDNFSEVTTMTMLAATHIMEMRGFMAIGKDDENNSPDGIIKNVVGYTPDEDPITQYQEHPGYAIIERAWRWRTKLLESLGATRKERWKMGADESNLISSLSDANSSLRSKIDKLTTIDITPED